MSRSRQKSPTVVIVRGSDGKTFRRNANKAMRAKTRAALSQGRFEEVPVCLEEVSDIYDYKDWRRYVTSDDPQWTHEELERQKRK